MSAFDKNSYNNAIAKRLKNIMQICDLERDGFALITNTSDSHLYAILNGNRRLTKKKAMEIGLALEFDGNLIFNLNASIPSNISKLPKLNKFKIDHKNNFEYFISTSSLTKKSRLVSEEIFKTNFLEQPLYLWEIKDKLKRISTNLDFDSDTLSKILNYLVFRQIISKEKRQIKLRSTGLLGKRMVDVFLVTAEDTGKQTLQNV